MMAVSTRGHRHARLAVLCCVEEALQLDRVPIWEQSVVIPRCQTGTHHMGPAQRRTPAGKRRLMRAIDVGG